MSHTRAGQKRTADPYKGLTISYNELNRADQITITTATNRYIRYTYNSGGQLIRKQAYDNAVLQKTTDYIDGFVYENSTLAYFAIPEGRVVNVSGTLTPEFVITDVQGNARISFRDDGNGRAVVTQENSYYAFGLTFATSPVALPAKPNKNLYNGGSEWQNDFSNLPDYYNTFFRNYDQALGRFISLDPLAELSESLTGYNYAGNNPVMFNDPAGDVWGLTGNSPGKFRAYVEGPLDWSQPYDHSRHVGRGGAGAFDVLSPGGVGGGGGRGSAQAAGAIGAAGGSANGGGRSGSAIAPFEAMDLLWNSPNGGEWSRSNGLVYYSNQQTALQQGIYAAARNGNWSPQYTGLRYNLAAAHINMSANAGVAGYSHVAPTLDEIQDWDPSLAPGFLLQQVEIHDTRTDKGNSLSDIADGLSIAFGTIDEGISQASRIDDVIGSIKTIGKYSGYASKLLGIPSIVKHGGKFWMLTRQAIKKA